MDDDRHRLSREHRRRRATGQRIRQLVAHGRFPLPRLGRVRAMQRYRGGASHGDRVADVLDDLDVEISVRKFHVEDEEAARQTELEISPTIRINGRDIQPNYTASACESSGDLCKTDDRSGNGSFIDCRDWSYRGETYSTPPDTLLVEKLLHAALAERGTIDSDVNGQYAVPENLREFFGTPTPRSATSSASDEATSDSESCC